MSTCIQIKLVTVIVLHYVVFGAMALTLILGFFNLPWYIALTLDALVARVVVSSTGCPLTILENKYRVKLNIPKSVGFLHDYILNPYLTWEVLSQGFNFRNTDHD